MNSRKKNAALVMTGVLVGTMLTGPAVHAAEEYFKAYRSNQAIYLDGQQIQLEAYATATFSTPPTSTICSSTRRRPRW